MLGGVELGTSTDLLLLYKITLIFMKYANTTHAAAFARTEASGFFGSTEQCRVS